MQVRRQRKGPGVPVALTVLAALCFAVVSILQFRAGETVFGWVALLAAAANVASVVLAVRGARRSGTEGSASHPPR